MYFCQFRCVYIFIAVIRLYTFSVNRFVGTADVEYLLRSNLGLVA